MNSKLGMTRTSRGIYMIAPPALPDPAPIMNAFIDRALAKGAQRFVLLGSSPVRHVHIDDAEAARRLEASGLPASYASLLVHLDALIREGAEDRVTDTVLRTTGHAPTRFEDFFRASARPA